MKVLIALDLSPHSAGMIREAASRPWPAKSQFLLLHVSGHRDGRVGIFACGNSFGGKTSVAERQRVPGDRNS